MSTHGEFALNYHNKYFFTQRELEVLQHLVDGKTNSEIGKELYISTNTAKFHVSCILGKMSLHSRVSAAVKAVREKIISLESISFE